MIINVTKGIGIAPTKLSAFDAALIDAGIANYNLLYLSSVIPEGSNIAISTEKPSVEGAWGDRLYVVIAQKRVAIRNQEAWAGIGWIRDPDTKRGLIVEHEGHSEAEVTADIKSSLDALAKNRNMEFSEHDMLVAGVKCQDLPVCALVVAVFQPRGWAKD